MTLKLKNNESEATDKVITEITECSPKEICGLIARILQLTSCRKKHPAILKWALN